MYVINEYGKEFDFKKRFEIKEGCTWFGDDMYFEEVKRFDTLEEAKEFLKNMTTKISTMTYNGTIYNVSEYVIQEMEYDDFEEDYISMPDGIEFSKIKVCVTNKETDEEKFFDNLKDAEDYQYKLDDAFISF